MIKHTTHLEDDLQVILVYTNIPPKTTTKLNIKHNAVYWYNKPILHTCSYDDLVLANTM